MDPLIGNHLGTLWEWGALVGVLATLCIIEGLVIKTLYNRLIKQNDDQLKVMIETATVLGEIKKELENAQ